MELLLLVSFAWWFTNFEPLQTAFDYIFTRLPINRYTVIVHTSLGCIKCVAFWSSLVISGDFFIATLSSLTAYLLKLCLDKMN
jgi:hypothetical protein